LAPTGEDGDFVEYPIPEQFKTTLNPAWRDLTSLKGARVGASNDRIWPD